jgi:transposase
MKGAFGPCYSSQMHAYSGFWHFLHSCVSSLMRKFLGFASALDRGHDADRIRERLAYDGIEPVIPPISTRRKKLPYDKELYRGRNRVARFFNKLKEFRRIATRYDKLAKTFFAALHLVAAFLIIRNS